MNWQTSLLLFITILPLLQATHASYYAYEERFTTNGNFSYDYDQMTSDEDKVAYAWSEPAHAAGSAATAHMHAASQEPYDDENDDGYIPEKAHPEWMWENCIQLESGEIVLNGTATCNVVVSGMDVHADLLTGGLDGVYELVECYEGKAVYVRQHSAIGEDRSLWFDYMFGDWQILLGEQPPDGDMVVYSNYGQVSPVDADGWHLAADYSSIESQYLMEGHQDLFFKMKGASVACDQSTQHQPTGSMGAAARQASAPAPAPAHRPDKAGTRHGRRGDVDGDEGVGSTGGGGAKPQRGRTTTWRQRDRNTRQPQ